MEILINEVRDLNSIVEVEIVEIMKRDEEFTLPYICVLRHQDERIFELIRSSEDEDTNSQRLILDQSKKINREF